MKIIQSKTAIVLIQIFTVVESVTLTVWFDLLGFVPSGNELLAFTALFIGLDIEHLIAGVSNNV